MSHYKLFFVVLGWIICSYTTDTIANETPQTREALYAQVLADELSRQPAGRGSVNDLETNPDFLRRFFAALHAYESNRVRPLTDSGHLIGQGACPKLPCGPLSNRSVRGQAAQPTVRSIRVSPVVADGNSVVLRWDRPIDRARYGNDSPIPIRYEVLVVDDHRYSLYQVTELQTFISPRGNRGQPTQSSLKLARGDEANPESPVINPRKPHSDWKVPQQYFVLTLDKLIRPSVFVRPVYATDVESKNMQADQALQSVVGPSGSFGVSAADFSDPVVIDLDIAKQRGGWGASHGNRLENCVINALGNYQAPSTLQSLDCTGYSIVSLEGIDLLTNLQTLILDGNPVSDLAPLSQLHNLRSLSLAFTNIHSIDALISLAQLESLVIANTQVNDISVAANFNALETLHAQNNQIIQIPDLSATAIQSLYLGGNPVTDVAGVRNLTQLQELKLNGTDVGDLDPIIDNAELPQSVLSSVDLSENFSLYCPQINALEAAIGSANLVSPTSCKQIPVPINLNPSVNPAVGANFTLTWALSDGNTQDFSYQLERRDSSRGDSELYSIQQSTTQFINITQLPVGTHEYSVKACLPTGASTNCGGESQILEVVVLINPDDPVSDFLHLVDDLDLRDCIDASASHSGVGDLTYLNCSNMNIETLEGLEHFPSIDSLFLNYNDITNIAAIAELDALYSVQLAYNQVPDSELSYIANGGEGHYSIVNLTNNTLTEPAGLVGLNYVVWLGLDSNQINSIDSLSNISISVLHASNNLITSVPYFNNMVSLSLENNGIQYFPGFCDVTSSDPLCIADQAIPYTLMGLYLSNTDLSSIGAEIDKFSNLAAITSASFVNTNVGDISFMHDWNFLDDLFMPGNPITDLSPLSGKQLLRSANLSGAEISSFDSLQNTPILSSVGGDDLTFLTSLSGIEALKSLNSISIGDSEIDPMYGLSPISELSNLHFINFISNDIFNIQSVFGLLDERQISGDFFRATLIDEVSIDCSQVAEILASPYYSSAVEIDSDQCMPSIPELIELGVQDDYQTISIAWLPAVEAPQGFTGEVSHYNIRYEKPGHTPPGATWDIRVDGSKAQLNWDASSFGIVDLTGLISIQTCRAENECTPFAIPQTVEMPLSKTIGINVQFDSSLPESAQINWGFIQNPLFTDAEFELRPLFPVSDISILSATSGSIGIQVPDVSVYPGLLARLYVCELNQDNERVCHQPSLVSFRAENISADIDPVTALNIDTTNNDQGAIISWNHNDPEVYFRVEEEDPSGNTLANYLIGENDDVTNHGFISRKFDREISNPVFKVRACKKDGNGNEDCSDPEQVSGSKRLTLTLANVALDPIYPDHPNNVCWFSDSGMPDHQNDKIRLRWSYDWKSGLGAGVQSDTPAYFSVGYCSPSQTISGNDCPIESSHKIAFNDVKAYLDENDEPVYYWESEAIHVTGDYFGRYTREFTVQPGHSTHLKTFLNPGPGVPAVTENNGDYEPILANQCAEIPEPSSRSGDSVPGGPDELKPGHWHSNAQPRQGWRFFWANEQRLDDHLGSFGAVYDLIGFWYTYRTDAKGHWTPTWYYTRMELVNNLSVHCSYFFEGALHYAQELGHDLHVGTVQVFLEEPGTDCQADPGVADPGEFQNAYLRVNVNSGDGVVNDETFEILEFESVFANAGANPFAGDNPSSHWNGVWTEGPLFKLVGGHLGTNNMFLTEWISGDGYSSALHTFDEDGEPIWLVDFTTECEHTNSPNYPNCGAPYPDYSDYRFQDGMHMVYPGFNPFWDASAETFSADYMNAITRPVSGGLGRQYKSTNTVEHELDGFQAKYCANLALNLIDPDPDSNDIMRQLDFVRGAQCDLDSAGATVELKKVASLHYFGYEVIDVDQCDLMQGSCVLELNWFTDDYFPNARPAVIRGNGQIEPLHQFCTNLSGSEDWGFAVYDQECIWDQVAEDYRFALVAGVDYAVALDEAPILARSRLFSATETPVDPNPEVPPGPASDPVPASAPVESSRIGATRGNFRVNEVGAATYSIPVMTVPGRGGVVPNVSLNYHSESGLGVMGRGGSIGGLSSITRCGQTISAGDGKMTGIQLNDEDRFCLDGQRLILASQHAYGAHDSVYRLEIDDFSRITAIGSLNGSPTHFEVQRKDGSKSTYGAADPASSARLIAPDAGVVFAWPISQIQDSVTNYIEFEYVQPAPANPGENTIEWHPREIRYTGHHNSSQSPFAKISFEYSTVPDTQRFFQYVAGQKLGSTQRLDWVDSFGDMASSQPLRRYRLTYELDSAGNNLLSSLQECRGSSSDNCFEPTVFYWNNGNIQPVSAPDTGGNRLKKYINGQFGDLDGNGGRNEYIFLSEEGFPYRFYNRRFATNASGEITNGPSAPGPFMSSEADSESPPSWRLLDLDVDGFNDVVYIINDKIYAHYGDGSAGGFSDVSVIHTLPSAVIEEAVFATDWNGDGKTDLVIANKPGDIIDEPERVLTDPLGGLVGTVRVLENTSTPGVFSFASGPIEAELRYELEGEYQHMPECISSATASDCSGAAGETVYLIESDFVSIVDGITADFNGDGKADFLVKLSGRYCEQGEPCEIDNPNRDNRLLPEEPERGRGTYDFYAVMSFEQSAGQTVAVISEFIGHTTESLIGFDEIKYIQAADFNTDGLADLLYKQSPGGWSLRMNTGNGFKSPVGQGALSNIRNEEAQRIQFVQTANDGTFDIVGIEHEEVDNEDEYHIRLYRWNWEWPGWSEGTTLPIDAGDINFNQWLFHDVTGNGIPDTLRIRPDISNQQGDWLMTHTRGVVTGCVDPGSSGCSQGTWGYKGWFRVNRITDGFGAFTDLEYRSLNHFSVYEFGEAGYDSNLGSENQIVYRIRPATYAVFRATSHSPQYELVNDGFGLSYDGNGKTSVEYNYAGARIQAGGRGFLGFREIKTYDPQTGVLTRTRYRQDFPFIGMPEATRMWQLTRSPFSDPDPGRLVAQDWVEGSCTDPSIHTFLFLGCSENHWESYNPLDPVEHPNIVHPYLQESREWSFAPIFDENNELTRTEFTHLVVTDNILLDDGGNMDPFGNVQEMHVNTYTSLDGNSDWVASQFTDNQYVNYDDSRWHLSRLTCANVLHERANPDPQISTPLSARRISTFGYDGVKGILNRETVNASDCGDPDGELRTDYLLDEYGNRRQTETTDSAAAETRKSRVFYDSGRFVEREEIYTPGGWRWTQKVEQRNEYGNPTEVIKGQADMLGNHPWQKTQYDPMGRPFYSYGSDGAWSQTIYSTANEYVSRCPSQIEIAFVEVQTASGGAEQLMCKDVLGRDVRTITQGFAEDQWINSDIAYDFASRPIAASEPYVDTTPVDEYCANDGVADATCLAPSQTHWTHTLYDNYGRVIWVKLPDDAEEFYLYGALTTTHTNALGQSMRTVQNVLGEKVSQTRLSEGATTRFEYDALGQLVKTDGPLHQDADLIEIGYDTLGRKAWIQDPDKGDWTYDYNAFGDLLCQTDQIGNSIAFDYDILGRQIRRFDRDHFDCNADELAGNFHSKTIWEYSDAQATPGFGQLKQEAIEITAISSGFGWQAMPAAGQIRDYDYDGFGRMIEVETTISEQNQSNRTYYQSTTYDQYGRVFQQFAASLDPTDSRGERFDYNDQGYLAAIYDARFAISSQTLYREVKRMNARGQVLKASLGNGTVIDNDYDPETGRPEQTSELLASGELAVFYDYAWDVLGRLQTRLDLSGAVIREERYGYDEANRLTDYWITEGDAPEHLQQQLRYNKVGNIECKSDVSGLVDCQGSADSYHYGNGAGPHALTQVDTASGLRTFTYDSNGNMTSDWFGGQTQRRFDYTPYNKVRRLEQENGLADRYTEFYYGTDRSRFLQVQREGSQIISRTHYIGNVEYEYQGSDFVLGQIRRDIGGIALEDLDITGRGKLRYQHRDHLGSIVALSTQGGQIHARMGFDPWGQRRSVSTAEPWQQWLGLSTPGWAESMLEATPRGFTGHEHLDDHGIIHMNGRIYDPHLARFLQADPFMEDTGTLNRYTYVHNNPLVYTDPSGYLSLSKLGRMAVGWALGGPLGAIAGYFLDYREMFSAALTILAPYSGLGGAILLGGISGYLTTNSVEGALWGAFAGAAFYGIGQSLKPLADGIGKTVTASITHGLAGGIIAEMQGGKFGHGFLSAGVTKLASPYIADIPDPSGVFLAALVGGTVSEVTGGKFANGAVTAAIAFSVNQRNSGSKRLGARQAEILERMEKFRDAHPDQPISLTGEELDILMSVDAELVRKLYGNQTNETRSEFHKRLRAADSPFIKFAGSQIEISDAGNLNGIHLAEDINYYSVGMVTAASNRSWVLMHGYVEIYNLDQFRATGEWHHIRQIPHAKRWARAGYYYYNDGE